MYSFEKYNIQGVQKNMSHSNSQKASYYKFDLLYNITSNVNNFRLFEWDMVFWTPCVIYILYKDIIQLIICTQCGVILFI